MQTTAPAPAEDATPDMNNAAEALAEFQSSLAELLEAATVGGARAETVGAGAGPVLPRQPTAATGVDVVHPIGRGGVRADPARSAWAANQPPQMPLPSARESAAETAAAVQLAEQQAAEAIVEQQQDTADHLRAVREVAHQMTANVSDAISTLGYQRALAPSALR